MRNSMVVCQPWSMEVVWSSQDFVDTSTKTMQSSEVTSAQEARDERRSAEVRVHQSEPERAQRSDDVRVAGRRAEWLLRLAKQAGF